MWASQGIVFQLFRMFLLFLLFLRGCALMAFFSLLSVCETKRVCQCVACCGELFSADLFVDL